MPQPAGLSGAAGIGARLGVLFALAGLMLLGPRPALAAPPAVEELRIVCEDRSAPFCYRDADGKAEGLLVDYWRLFGRKAGMSVDIRAVPAEEAVEQVADGRADVHAGLNLTPANSAALTDRLEFSRPLLEQGFGVFSRGEAPRGEQAENLAGFLPGHGASAALATSYPHLPQRAYPDIDALAAALALGHVRVAAGPRLRLLHRLRAFSGARAYTLLAQYPGTALRAAVRSGDATLLARINAGLAAMDKADIARMEERWTREPSPMPVWAWGAAFGVVCLALGLALWDRSRRVRSRAKATLHETGLLRDNLLGEMARHRKTQDLLLKAVEQSPSGIIIGFAENAAPLVANSQALKLLGLTQPPPPEMLAGERPWHFFTPSGRLLHHTEMPLSRALVAGESMVNEEFRLVLPGGEERWLLVNAAPVLDNQDKVRAGVVVLHDITDSRQAERELARFKFILEAAVEEVYLVRPDGRLAYVNEAVARSLGYQRQELLEASLETIDPAYSAEATYRLLHRVRQSPRTFESLQRTADGLNVLKEIKAFYMRFGDEEYICAFAQDITERNRLQRELRRTRALFAASLEQAPWGIIIGDAASGRVSIANPVAAQMLGVEPAQLVGMDVNGTMSQWTFLDENDEVVTPGETPLGRALLLGESTRGLEVRFLLGAGPERWLLADCSPVRAADGGIMASILVMADITRRKQLENQMAFKALHDLLTGLPNRARCLELVEQALDTARATGKTFAVAFADLDRFKMLNDSLGHSFGDRVLIAAARCLEHALAGDGQVCRFGGDEFVLLVDKAVDLEVAQERIRQAMAALCQPVHVDGQEVRLTASVGVVLCPTEDQGLTEGAEQVLQHADLAMHRAKDTGRDRIRVFHPGMLRRAQELLSLDADMRRGLEHEEFLVYYQPVMSGKEGEILGFEALARWQSPKRGLVGPHSFISHAEESGLIVPLGEQVLRQACQTMANWRRAYPAARRMTLAVNLSARQFTQVDMVDNVRKVLRETGLPPALLKLELTESTLMGDPENALAAMRRLKALGVSLAIDDFGTGYSSLAYLQRFPVDILKIDRSFVRDLPRDDADSRALVRAIAALAGSLRLGVVAEGVETREQLDILLEMGLTSVQGFLFHPPLPVAEVEQLLSQPSAD